MEYITKDDIVNGLRALNLSSGITLMVHSSLSSFGWVDGGAKTVVKGLLKVLGESGTLVVPTFSYYLRKGERLWDRENTPSRMGIISETVRTWPGSIRSDHASHPLSAIGPNAELICRRPHKTGFGPDSPFKTLVDIDAYILLMGVTYRNCTLFHLIEAEAHVPYRFLEERKATVIIDGIRYDNVSAWEYTLMHGAANDFMRLGRILEERDLVESVTIGQSTQLLFRARDGYNVGLEMVKKDPLFLLREDLKGKWNRKAD